MQDLIIVGDSWGCGAWSSPQGMHMTPDDYFSKYFSKNYKVTNLSKGAKSNKNSLENLIDFLVNSDIDTIQQTKYLFIQTDPLRDVLIHRGAFSENLFQAKWLNDAHQLLTVSESLLMLTYLQLQHHAKAQGIVINVTGGCSDIVGLDSKYDSLNVVCDSFYKLIDNDHVNSQHSNTGMSTLFKFDLDLMTKETRQYIEQIIEDVYIKSNLKFNNLSDKDNQRYFGYYADNHPSHMGIDMWIEHMLPRIK